jgi:hypothetical protein
MRIRNHSRELRRFVALFVALAPVAVFGQDRATWSTTADIREGTRGTIVGTVDSIDVPRLTFVLRPDAGSTSVRITADDVTTSFRAFGDGSTADVVRGSVGMNRLRAGDRLRVTGIGGRSSIAATEVNLLGRATSSSVRGTTTTTTTRGYIEGTVRSVNTRDSTLVVETADRRLYTVRATDTTPVNYRGTTYRIANLESGDTVRVKLMSTSSTEDRASSIEVLRNVAETSGTDSRTLTSVYGRITRIDTRLQTVRVTTDRETVITVDMRDARDRSGRDIMMSDLHVGDVLEVSGRYDTAGTFQADTVRLGATRDDIDSNGGYSNDTYDDGGAFDTGRYRAVAIEATVEEALGSNDLLIVRDRAGDRRRISLLVDEEMIVRTTSGSYITADQLRVGERISIRAFELEDGTTVAQTIRVR